MLSTLHFTHHGNETMMKQTRGKIFWPGMRDDLLERYKNCEECREHKPSKAQMHNEISQNNMFDNYLPGQKVQIDYAVKGNQNYLSMVCALTGFIKVFKTANQSKNEVMRCVREWVIFYGMPYAIKADSGPSFRLAFKKDLEELGVRITHNSAYRSQNQGLVER